jgi:thioester reductase-like protein
MSDKELLQALQPTVEKLNRESQDHARIPFHMLIPMPHQTQPLEKSSKGTLVRKAADSRFEKVVNDAYDSQEADEADEATEIADDDLSKHLTELIQSMTAQSAELSEDMDLFSYGVDSIACMQLRTRLKRLMPSYQHDLPMSVIEDCGTIRRLTDYVLRRRHGEQDSNDDDEEQLMLDLVQQYGSFKHETTLSQTNGQNKHKQKSGGVVVLTGATGALGAHILDILQQSQDVKTIYCLVRGADEYAAKERVSKALQQRGLSDLLSTNANSQKVHIVQAQLSDERLGLDEELYEYLAREVTSIIHVAWTVNFRLKLRSFVKDNIAGVRHLLDLALKVPRQDPPRFTYCSSTASIMNSSPGPDGCLQEHIQPIPSSASPLGYSRSKWVAEHICLEAYNQTSLHGHVAVVRVGQLTGDSMSGVWNTKEAWPMMLSTARLTNCLPDLGSEPLDWLPVDIAARAFVQITEQDNKTIEEMPVYHVLNPHQEPTWHQMLEWIKEKEDFEIVQPREWIGRLEKHEGSEHSALKLLGLWKEAYGNGDGKAKRRAQFAMEETKRNVAALRDVQPLDKAYVDRMWAWIQANVR